MFIIMLAALLLLLWGWNTYYGRHWYRNVKVSLDFDRANVYAGESSELTEVITNRKRLPVPVLEVGFHARRELVFQDTENTNVSDYTYKRDIFAVMGRQRITRRIPIQCRKRGFYQINEADITAFSLLYQKRHSRSVATKAQLYVYPAQVDVSQTMAVCERMSGLQQCAKHLCEDPFTFRGIREYTTDDPMKAINWKASAKMGGLMVNTFDSVMTQKVMLYLDVEDSGILKQEELVEESIAAAASIIRRLVRQGVEAGLATNARYDAEALDRLQLKQPEVSIKCSNSKGLLTRMERSLALYHKENGWSAYETCLDKADLEDAVLIFISKNATKERQQLIETFLGKEQYGIWLCPAYRGEKPALQTAPNLRLVIREVEKG